MRNEEPKEENGKVGHGVIFRNEEPKEEYRKVGHGVIFASGNEK